MGFFSELKEDLSQAVNELMPDAGNEGGEMPERKAAAEETADLSVEEEKARLDAALERVDSIEVPEEAAAEESGETSPRTAGEIRPEDTEEAFRAEPEAVPAEEVLTEKPEETVRPEETEKAEEKVKGAEKKMDVQLKSATDENALITAGMTVTGDVSSEGSMEVIGTINGNITLLGKLNVTGTITGNSKAAEVYADNAKINGEISSEGSVKIGQSSVVIGNIFAKSAVIAGAVKGDIDVHGPVVLDASAIVMGNIKSKAVQINNGAVIEGMCSQCYADVNPASFFEEYKKTKK